VDNFYITGGTLQSDARCYVQRKTDDELLQSLKRGEFCYVLTSRQMGKSSLMVRTAARLREEGTTVAILDLTEIGQNVTPEQWYKGLLSVLCEQLNIEDDLSDFWQEHRALGPLQRWMKALRELVLARRSDQIVIFIDEIDAVRSLPFSTDEFFAGIREFYNRRTEHPDLMRLTFCLLGVATPSDLIRDTRTTPFNIGHRIELDDFTEAEAAPLARGLGKEDGTAERLMKRILYWTHAHPYLTQRLCRAVAEEARAVSPDGVDRMCKELFLSPRARERDDNLLFVRERILRSEVDLAGLLDLYGNVRRGKRVNDDEANPLISLLRLSGITRVENGRLRVRNRIYERVFDRTWVTDSMPDAERRRQRAAFRRGVLRTAAIASVILIIVSALAFFAIEQRDRAQEQETINRRLLYAAHMNLAMQAWERGDVGRVLEMLNNHQPKPGQEDLRGFEWYYLWRASHSEQLSFRGHTHSVTFARFSPDGKTLATASWDKTAKLWEVATGRELITLTRGVEPFLAVAFSPDGKVLVTAGADAMVKLWDVMTGREVATLTGHTARVNSVIFSPDGTKLATASFDTTVKLWDAATGRALTTFIGHTRVVNRVVFSPAGRQLASGSWDGTVRLWDVATGRSVTILNHPGGDVETVAFSPDGKWLAAGGWHDAVELVDITRRRKVAEFKGHTTLVTSVEFSPDGQWLATGSYDGTAKVWDVATQRELTTLKVSTRNFVTCVTFSPDGKSLVTGSDDGIARLWDIATEQDWSLLKGHAEEVRSLAFSPDGATLATASHDKTAKLWETGTGRELATFSGHTGRVGSAAFSPDGRLLATVSDVDNSARIWDVATGKTVAILSEPGMGHARFFPDGQRLAAAYGHTRLKIWRVATWQAEMTLQNDTPLGDLLAISPDGKRLVTGNDIGTIEFWDADTLQELEALKGHTDVIAAAAFSPDGTILATASFDGTTKLFDAATRQELATLKGHRGWVYCLAFSPDGKRLATGSMDMTVRIWDVPNREELVTLKGHTDLVTAVAFSPDGTTLATASRDNTVKLWRAATEKEVVAGRAP
jgi:WD40 repeat protein